MVYFEAISFWNPLHSRCSKLWESLCTLPLVTVFFPCGITQAQLALNDLDGALWSLTNASQLEPNDGKQMVDHLLI